MNLIKSWKPFCNNKATDFTRILGLQLSVLGCTDVGSFGFLKKVGKLHVLGKRQKSNNVFASYSITVFEFALQDHNPGMFVEQKTSFFRVSILPTKGLVRILLCVRILHRQKKKASWLNECTCLFNLFQPLFLRYFIGFLGII